MKSIEFAHISHALSHISNVVRITADHDGVRFKILDINVNGSLFLRAPINTNYCNNHEGKMAIADNGLLGLQVSKFTTALFSLRHLARFSKAAALSDEVHILMADNAPIFVSNQLVYLTLCYAKSIFFSAFTSIVLVVYLIIFLQESKKMYISTMLS